MFRSLIFKDDMNFSFKLEYNLSYPKFHIFNIKVKARRNAKNPINEAVGKRKLQYKTVS